MQRSTWFGMALVCGAAQLFAAPLVEEWDGFVPAPGMKAPSGASAFSWPTLGETTSVQAKGVAGDLSAVRSVRFWLHVAEPKDTVLTVVFSAENPETEGADYYSLTVKTNFTGWREILRSRDELGAARTPLGWDQIGRIFFSSNWDHQLDPETVVHVAGFTLSEQPLPGAQMPPGELLKNRGFELDRNYDDQPDGWSYSTFRTGTKVDLVDGGHAGKAVRIQGVPEGKCRGGTSCSVGPDRTDANALYVMSAWAKVTGDTSPTWAANVRFTSVNEGGAVVKSEYKKCPAGPFDWRPLHWLVQLAPDVHRFNIVLFHHGSGTAFWDDVSLLRCHPGKALSPEPHAFAPDGRPELRWEAPADARGKLVLVGDGAPAFEKTYAVQGSSFRVPEPLPTGREYLWYVLVDGDGDPQVTAFANEDGEPVMGRVYSGNWQDRARQMTGDLTVFREAYRRLKAFAARNGMWDQFSMLGNLLRALDADELPKDVAVPKLMESVRELRLRMPWWQRVFLDDAGFYDRLNLELPGLEQVAAAVAANDYPTARKQLLAYYLVSVRESPVGRALQSPTSTNGRGSPSPAPRSASSPRRVGDAVPRALRPSGQLPYRDYSTRKAPSYYRKWEKRPSWNPARKKHPKAEVYLTHKMPIHSYETPTYDVGREFDWHIFPIVDVEWPTKIHRHFHWNALAGGYWSTGNEAYSNEIVRQMYDWGQDNPMERWDRHRYRWAWSTLNATIRIYSTWTNAWLRIRESKSWTPDAQFVMMTLLREHGQFLMTKKTRAGRSNWSVAESRGLVELGIMFPEYKEAAAWRAEGFRRLREDVDLQVLADGVHVERTPGYHGMTLSCFMEPLRLALLNRVDFEGRDHFIAKLESMYEFYLYGCDPNSRMAQIGDGHQMSVISRMRQAAEMFGREDMRYIATEGKDGVMPVHRSYGFESAGLYVSRSAWNDPKALWSIMDWGAAVGHCHEDMGQICLRAYGKPLLIDSGIYSYAFPMRSYFHWTIGHNTLMVDEKPQKRRAPLSCAWVTTDRFDYVRGLTDNSDPVLHERSLVFKQPGTDGPGYWMVLDRVTGEGRHRLDQRWHPNEKFKGTVAGSSVVFTSADEADPQPSLVLAALPAENLRTAVVEGAVSYEWYKKLPVDVAQFTREGDVPAVLATVLYPTPEGQAPAKVRVTRLPATLDGKDIPDTVATAFVVNIDDDGKTYRDTWIFRHDDKGVVKAGDMTLDGRMAMVRDQGAWLVAEGAGLMLGGQTLFSAAEPIQGVSRVGTILACTDGKDLRVASDAPLAVNGGEPAAPVNGVVSLATVAAPVVPPEPRSQGPVKFEIEPPPEPIPASGYARMLPPEARLTDNSVVVNAADLSGEGGGKVEITTKKVGAHGKAFLHWDRAGHWLEYTFDLPAAGHYTLLLRACTSEGAVVRKITVAGKTRPATEAQEIAGTGGYSNSRNDWRIFAVADKKTQGLVFDLPQGAVKVRLENIGGHSLNLNWLALVPRP